MLCYDIVSVHLLMIRVYLHSYMYSILSHHYFINNNGIDISVIDPFLKFADDIFKIKSLEELKTELLNITLKLSEITKPIREIKSKQKFNNVLDYINNNYINQISLNDVSEVIGVTPEYFCGMFKKLIGINFLDYLTDIRISKAKQLLVENEEKVYKIAEQVGYVDSKYFTTLFKNHVGVTPIEYRKYMKKIN